MKEFVKKSLFFGLINNLVVCFFQNVTLFQKNEVFKLSVDGWSIVVFTGIFIYSFAFVGIIKLIACRINNFIYSYKMIAYIAFTHASIDWVINLLGRAEGHGGIISYLIIAGQLVFCTLLLYYGWKYRFELSTGVFLGQFLFAYNIVENTYRHFSHKKPKNVEEFYLITAIVLMFLIIAFILRKLNVYDFRSQKDKQLEVMGEGPYKRKGRLNEPKKD